MRVRVECDGRAGARTKLQLALDVVTPEEAEVLLAKVLDLVDIVEVGTPFLLRDGVGALRRLRAAFPGVKLLADMKIMDGGRLEATMGFEAGAKLVTVLAAAEDATLRRVVRAAKEMGGEVMVDLIGVKDLRRGLPRWMRWELTSSVCTRRWTFNRRRGAMSPPCSRACAGSPGGCSGRRSPWRGASAR